MNTVIMRTPNRNKTRANRITNLLVTAEVYRIANSARATMLCIPVTMKVIMAIAHTIVMRLPINITRIMSISHAIFGDSGFCICHSDKKEAEQ